MDRNIGLRGWYYNKQRICELLGASAPNFLMPYQEAHHFSRIMKEYLFNRNHNISDLGSLLLSNQIKQRLPFTIVHDFYGRALSRKDETQRAIWCKLNTAPQYKLVVQFNSDHITSSTGRHVLGGRVSAKFVFAYIGNITDNVITAHPYVIADLVEEETNEIGSFVENFGELGLDKFDAFSGINSSEMIKDTKILKDIPEQNIKQYFADIIGEPSIPKDWGGEKSDLLSDRVLVNGQRQSVAFCFKGPSVFKKLEISDLGKNGDQIMRLFEEPANILVQQHCCSISSAVRNHMRSMANRPGNFRRYAVIDGYDTVRILKMHGKI